MFHVPNADFNDLLCDTVMEEYKEITQNSIVQKSILEYMSVRVHSCWEIF